MGPIASPFLTQEDVVGTFGYLAPEYFIYGKFRTLQRRGELGVVDYVQEKEHVVNVIENANEDCPDSLSKKELNMHHLFSP
ncbi:hypothetical protein TanjilG_19947 [Lupinus angustifolius]|uniref:Protein kinase domain-containing protein n=1 Tax=Lupinus angustifolius TaxID=3871 RepID=A0A1J7FNP0_LUPAN|nr:hypothetical protein TanjilG_19947 [Lupinus angustifolius]